ncbi:MAG TPA: glycoside hydrolase family 3 C-terminal domain-containing protein, partial [Rhodoglobus sp.]|nr:glycoside hydrolase family 3 C-terminal domain-containing protein [Rhodoglobus sp.]
MAAHSLTPQQQAALTVGSGYWTTQAVPGVPSIVLSDGPHGLRRQPADGDNLGLGDSEPATCFPPAVALGSSWDPSLVAEVAAAIGDEARAAGVHVVLGPGVNLKRSPLCGRNFEYYSEDPLLSGELGAAWVRGLQSRGVGASLKHFAVNNQETARMTVSAEVDERTLRELYLPAFERIVTRERPWTVMAAYNALNGVPAAEHRWLLTELLRGEWGYEGAVISDWGAVAHRGRSLEAGLDLEMPGPQPSSIDEALAVDPAILRSSTERIAALVERAGPAGGEVDLDAHHALARRAAAESIVLLRNEGGLLPLDPSEPVAVIGALARDPRIQGAGSSLVNPTRLDTPLAAISAVAPTTFAESLEDAVAAAREARTAIVFAGLLPGDESEGFDRHHLDLRVEQVEVIRAVAAANPRTVVVLSNGGVVSLEGWHDQAAGILETWLLGQAAGTAIADVLFGAAEPGGRLAETIPLRLQDTPSYLNFPGDGATVFYGERLFVGYRHYETVDVPVRYPFGFGLGYTTFEFADLVVRGHDVEVTVTNTGARDGAEVVQVYVGAPGGRGVAPR